MSDNVIEIFENKKRISLKKQWFIFISIVVLIVVLLVWFLFTQTTLLDSVKRFFRYLGIDENSYGNIRFEAFGDTSYAMVEDTFAVASQNGLQMFAENGEALLELSGNFVHPMFDTYEDYLLLYDVGGTQAVLADADGEILCKVTRKGKIFDADLTDDGKFAILYEGSDCCAVLDVVNENGKKLFSHSSESAFLNTCALSPDGSYVAVTTLGQEDISFLSTARVFSTSSDETLSTVSFGTQMICDMAFLDDGRICAIGEDTLFFFSTKGKLTEKYVGESAKIAGFCFTESELMILYDRYDPDSGYELQCLSAKGKKTASTTIKSQPIHFSQCENYLSILTQEEVLVYDHELKLRSQKAQDAYLAALAREDGTALCVGTGRAKLFIP